MRCPDEDSLLRLELGELTVNETQSWNEHIAGCPGCRDRRTAIAQLLSDVAAAPPSSEAADDAFVARVTAGAAATPREPAARRRPNRTPLAALTAAAALMLLLPAAAWRLRGQHPAEPLPTNDRSTQERERASDVPGTVTARGKAEPTPIAAEVLLLQGGRLVPVEGRTLGSSDALAVRVTNGSDRTVHLMAFAVDAAGDIHWLYPAYQDARSNPTSVAVGAGTKGRLMAEVVQPDAPAAGALRLVTLVAKAPLTVKEVELRLAGQPAGADVQASFPTATIKTWSARWEARR